MDKSLPFIHRHFYHLPTIWQMCNFLFATTALGMSVILFGDNWKEPVGIMLLFVSWQCWDFATNFETI